MAYQAPPPKGAGDADLTPLVAMAKLGLRGWAASVWVFMRKDIGTDALSWQGLAGVPVLFLYAGFGECPEALLVYLPLYLLVAVLHRIRSLPKRSLSRQVHSCYEGTPWLANRLFFFLRPSEAVAKGILEPALAASLGVASMSIGAEPLGLYFLIASFCMFAVQATDQAEMAARAKAWRDREWEGRAFEAYIRRNRR